MARRDPARIWLRWAREAHHGDVALACLDRAMALGDADARFEHALLEAEGLFGAGEPAINLRRAAEHGHVEAMARLVDCLRWGPGKERDAEQARLWLTRAAEAGFRPAAESLARWMEESGEAESAAAWRQRATVMPPRALRAGLLKPMESRDPLVRAEAAAARAADGGFDALLRQPWAPAFFTLLVIELALGLVAALVIGTIRTFGLPLIVIAAYYLLFGRGQRHAWRFRRLVDAAEAGDGEAAFQLGRSYLSGMPGFAPDALSAAVWFRRAAETGHRGAMAALAEALRSGYGIRWDAQEAEAWAAASRG
ncbi:MAG TPA: hypothetical protein VNV60_01205 [Holophagaceae bacterium]|jgi:TPR repeat protein|nr:hypothetical protein [Holophagaceae bacterium]